MEPKISGSRGRLWGMSREAAAPWPFWQRYTQSQQCKSNIWLTSKNHRRTFRLRPHLFVCIHSTRVCFTLGLHVPIDQMVTTIKSSSYEVISGRRREFWNAFLCFLHSEKWCLFIVKSVFLRGLELSEFLMLDKIRWVPWIGTALILWICQTYNI